MLDEASGWYVNSKSFNKILQSPNVPWKVTIYAALAVIAMIAEIVKAREVLLIFILFKYVLYELIYYDILLNIWVLTLFI